MSSAGPAHGPPRWIVLDDLDSSINYEGDSWYTASDSKENFEEWDNAGFGLTYLGSLHGTDSDAKMSFTFDGSAVLLTGSNNPLNESGVVTPAYECFMDGVKFGEQTTFPFPANNWDICNWSSTDGKGGNHTLSVEIKTSGQSFYADKIKYVPTPGSKAAMELGGGDNPENVVELTRNDLGIKLGSGWGTLGDTANVTQRTGAKAEINFFGSRLSWWAFIPGEFAKSPTTGSYTIDDGNPTSFTLRGLAANQPTTYNQMLFQTPSLPRGPHKMVVTYNGGQGVTPLPLTNLLVTNGNATVPVEGDPTVFDLASLATSNPSPSGTGKPGGGGSDNSDEGGGGGTSVGAIAGGVVGGLVIIAAAIFALFFLRRRKQRRKSIDIDNPVVVPFSPQNNSRPLMAEVHSNDGHYDGGHGGGENSMYGGSSGYAGANSAVSPSTYSNTNTNTFSSNSGYQNAGAAAMSNKIAHRANQQSMSSSDVHQSSSSGGAAALVPRRKGDVVPEGSTTSREQSSGSRVMRHEDSGVRMNQQEEEPLEELPPLYTAR